VGERAHKRNRRESRAGGDSHTNSHALGVGMGE
jgi:hypothetical protein